MKNRLTLLLITLLAFTLTAKADFEYEKLPPEAADFTGEAFFSPSTGINTTAKERKSDSKSSSTIPPIKRLRLLLQAKRAEKSALENELAPTAESTYEGEVETSDFVPDDKPTEFENMAPDGFEADEESISEKKEKKHWLKKQKTNTQNSTEEIVLDCENIDYDTPNYLINANGNVNVKFVKQGTTVKADHIVFDRMNNTIKAEGNVRILKNGRTVTGDYIFVDLNEENALIENPLTRTSTIEIKAQKGYVYGDKIVQENGSLNVSGEYPLNMRSGKRGPNLGSMIMPKSNTFAENVEKGIFKLKAKEIKITQKGDLEVISIKKGKISKGKRTIFYIPAIKIYTNKNHDYVESNFWEIGSYRGLGVYTGPGWVFELPKGSVLKAIPFFNYKSGAGIGGMARFSSGTNVTTAAYGTAASKFFVYGEQLLDDKLSLNYSMNSYMDEWFLGRRRPKYGAELVYRDTYSSNNFLLKGHASSFSHRIDAGYFHDLDFDGKFEKVQSGGRMGTTRFRYMASVDQNFLNYRNEEKMTAFSLGALAQLSAAIYGTGDTQIIGRVGPHLHTQYKRWMQDISYTFTSYDDNTPMRRFDAYRYGRQTLYLRETFRLNKWLALSWFTSICITNDSVNHKRMQENSFYLSVGPEDMKMHLGYDFARQTLYCNFELMMNAKGTNVEYEKFEIKQDKKANKENKLVEKKPNNYEAPTSPKILEKAVIENVKVMEDVL